MSRFVKSYRYAHPGTYQMVDASDLALAFIVFLGVTKWLSRLLRRMVGFDKKPSTDVDSAWAERSAIRPRRPRLLLALHNGPHRSTGRTGSAQASALVR